MLIRSVFCLLACLCSAFVVAQDNDRSSDPPLRWWKGNLHTHSLWSDGDEFPEMIADWYSNRGYHFLAITDHNVLSDGMRWMSLKRIVSRSDEGILDRYRQRFGESWVETRVNPKTQELQVRLKPMHEFRALLEQREKFILIPAEEISDRAGGKPVHINATNLAEALAPVGGSTVREAIQNNLRVILEHEKKHGREVLPHLNHPNFHYAVSAEDLAAVVSERFYEVYNGHPGVNHLGDEDHPGVEKIWDLVNAIRRTSLSIPPLMGIATDDSHEYHGKKGSRPGRGWVMVRSRYLTPEHLIKAMKRGDFYASSGVTLADVAFNKQKRSLDVSIDGEEGATYSTAFIVTKRGEGEERIGVRVAEIEGKTASYAMSEDDLYVRAVVTSSKDHVDPSFENQNQQAWTQPVGWQSTANPADITE